MKVVFLPARPKSLVFDIDGTLHDSRDYIDSQGVLLLAKVAEYLGISITNARKRIDEVQESFAVEHGGRQSSLGNALLQLGVPEANCVQWREELFRPEEYLKPNPRLIETLSVLGRSFLISAVTNNPTSVALRALSILGIKEYFFPVVGLELAGQPKPTMIPFELVAQRQGVELREMISIGDRFEVDIELPLQNGMGGIVVEGLEDIYRLPEVLQSCIG